MENLESIVLPFFKTALDFWNTPGLTGTLFKVANAGGKEFDVFDH